MILVDTNVLLDILAEDPVWEPWSTKALHEARARDNLAVNNVIYAELSPGYQNIGELDGVLDALGIANATVPKFALFLAGHAFRQYRRRRGVKTGVLPDFFIGAHAFVEDAILLTRDPRRIHSYFPAVALISP
ncbi:MAG TPA: type II toxin-antitoxin system VapC family toxin [Rhizomicrobium sp.]